MTIFELIIVGLTGPLVAYICHLHTTIKMLVRHIREQRDAARRSALAYNDGRKEQTRKIDP